MVRSVIRECRSAPEGRLHVCLHAPIVRVANEALDGYVALLSVGHRTRLFDVLAGMCPSTSADIAAAAELEERYVREWLACMVVAGIVLFDPIQQHYRLPAEHASLLTRAAAPNNLAVLMQYIAVLGSVEDEIVECFHNGGGVPYSSFGRFHEVLAEDLSAEAIGRATAARHEKEFGNVRFVARDATTLPRNERYDLITTFDAIHDQAHPARVLAAIHGALRTDGVYLMQDIAGSSRLEGNLSHPLGPLFCAVSCMHCMTVSLAAGGDGLGTLWGRERALSMLREASFAPVEVHQLPGDIQNDYYVARRGRAS